jgi:death-on-curing family protein
MTPVRFLTAQQLQLLHYIHITPLVFKTPSNRKTTTPIDTSTTDQDSSICDPCYLESAASSPVNHHHYGGVDDTFQLAALLAEKVALNHAFRDGNKRTALYAADMFLRVNGGAGLLVDDPSEARGISPRGLALADAMVDVATRKWSAEDLAKLYRDVGVSKSL